MGPRASKGEADLLADFQVERRMDTEGLLLLRKKDNRREYLLREMTFNDRKEFDRSLSLMEQKKAQLSGCKFLCNLERVASKAEDQYCSTFYKVYALFEFGQRTLEMEVAERRQQQRRFQENELWSILASCILGLAHLQKNGIRHQALKSGSILISKEGVVRVFDPITTGIQTNFQNLCTRRNTSHLYLSPQLTQSLQQESTPSNINPYKSDIFTLAVIVLEAGLLQYQDECYRDECARVHWETVQYHLHRFREYYGEELAGLVELMLSREERARPDWLQLEERVIREEENKSVSLLNISKETKGSQLQGRVSNNPQPFITSQVVPVYQSAANTQRHSHLYRPSPSLPHRNTTSDVVTRFPPIPVVPQMEQSQSYSGRVVCVAPSYIEATRPLRSIFPVNSYVTNTKIDENLVVVTQEERTFEAETPNNRNNSAYFDTNLKSPMQNTVPLYQQQQYHSYTPTGTQPALVNTYGVSFFPTNTFSPPMISSTPNPPLPQGEYVVQRYKQGSEYKGYKVEGMRHGQGIFYYQDGGMYEGEWRFNKMQGRGKLFYQSGKLAYEGEWANDQFSGSGVLYNEYPDVLHEPINFKNLDEIEEYWTKYEGQFHEDLKSGHGILFLSNGQYYQGQFDEDMANGQGRFVRMNGEAVVGRWLNNVFVG